MRSLIPTNDTVFAGSFLFDGKVSSNGFYFLAAKKFASHEKIRLVENRLKIRNKTKFEKIIT